MGIENENRCIWHVEQLTTIDAENGKGLLLVLMDMHCHLTYVTAINISVHSKNYEHYHGYEKVPSTVCQNLLRKKDKVLFLLVQRAMLRHFYFCLLGRGFELPTWYIESRVNRVWRVLEIYEYFTTWDFWCLHVFPQHFKLTHLKHYLIVQ